MYKKTLFIIIVFITNIIYSQTTYYVDADATDDLGNGTSEATAWKSITKVNSSTFSPGDQILFNVGDTFYGKLVVTSSGDATAQITFGKYGDGERPIINGRNYKECIRANGVEYLTFNDLELVNNSDEDTGIIDVSTPGKKNGAEYKRFGFTAYPGGNGTIKKNIILNNLKIHSIYPPIANDNDEFSGDGIQFTTYGNFANNIFDGITIENCEIYDTGILGIGVNRWIKATDPPPIENRHHKNVTVKNNYIHHTGGSGAVYFYVEDYLFENNIFTYTGDYSSDVSRFGDHDDDVNTPDIWYKRQRGRGSGFWCVRTKNGILQYNEFSHAHGPKDSCGAHIDIENDNIIIQYNLSWDNAGGFAEYMGANTNCIYRYNISINDGWRVKYDASVNPTPATHPQMYTAKGDTNGQRGAAIWFSNYYGCATCDVGSTDNQVYNNTFYIGKHVDDGWEVDINSFIELEPDTNDNEIKNNIFYIATNSSLSYLEDTGSGTGNVMQYNLYTNGGPDDTDSDIAYNSHPNQNEIYNTDPLLINVGGLTADDYKIKPGSPAIDQGVNIVDNGGLDYWLNSLASILTNDFDIGAHERMCSNNATFSGSWDSGPTSSDLVTINSNYTLPNSGSFDACQLVVGTGATLTIPAGEYINVNGNITVNGTLLVENEGSIVQVDDAALVKNSGTITVEKISPLLTDRDFMILGSPMSGESTGDVYSAAAFIRYHDTDNFTPHPLVEAENPLAGNWADDNGDNWLTHTGALTVGEGYLVKPFAIGEPGGTYSTSYTKGTLNNGIITFTTKYNTVGTPVENQNASPNILSNPYASAIDAKLFISSNALVDDIYFWEHITSPNASYPGYNSNNYDMGDISYHNGLMGVEAAHGGGIPSDFIPSGQGFGVKANALGDVTFNNVQRVTGNNTGYRNSNADLDKLYVRISNETYGLKSSMGIGFTELATDDYGIYDTKRLATSISLYSLVETNELGIQGRSVFNLDHIIPLGFSTQVEESQEYTISISSIEGDLISNATIYLKDNYLNTLTNLSETDYTFTSNAGHQTDRFIIVFTDNVLGNNDLSIASITIYPNPTQNILNIVSSPNAAITGVAVYDVRGRILITKTLDNQESYQLDLSTLDSSLYFVKISTQRGSVTKRIIKK